MKRILVAEDNAVNRELLREMLEVFGCDVVEARDGHEALATMEESAPDLVLLDINMPGMNGFDVLKRIREHPTFSDIPVFAVTAYAMKEDQERVLEAGFHAYLPKPISSSLLFTELKRFGVVAS